MAEMSINGSRLAFRAVAAITITNLGLALGYPAYSRAIARGWIGTAAVLWTFASCIGLALYVVFTARRIQKSERKAFLIDVALVISCYVLLVSLLVYTVRHHAII